MVPDVTFEIHFDSSFSQTKFLFFIHDIKEKLCGLKTFRKSWLGSFFPSGNSRGHNKTQK